MPRWFAIVASAGTVVVALAVFLHGVALLAAVAITLSFSAWALAQWRRHDRDKKLKAVAFEQLQDALRNVNSSLLGRVNDVARAPEMCVGVVQVLIELAQHRADPTERYWAYIALGQIGGMTARKAIMRGLKREGNEFAQRGVQEAMKLVGLSPRKRRRGCDSRMNRR